MKEARIKKIIPIAALIVSVALLLAAFAGVVYAWYQARTVDYIRVLPQDFDAKLYVDDEELTDEVIEAVNIHIRRAVHLPEPGNAADKAMFNSGCVAVQVKIENLSPMTDIKANVQVSAAAANPAPPILFAVLVGKIENFALAGGFTDYYAALMPSLTGLTPANQVSTLDAFNATLMDRIGMIGVEDTGWVTIVFWGDYFLLNADGFDRDASVSSMPANKSWLFNIHVLAADPLYEEAP